MSGSSPQELAEALIALGSINHHVNKHAVASLTWITYDILICMSQEVELVWRTRWTVPKVLYIALRYSGVIWLVCQCVLHLTPGSKISDLSCKSSPTLQVVGLLILWILVDMILLLRIRALYHGKKSHGMNCLLLLLFEYRVTYIPLNSLYLGLSLYKFFQNLKGMRTWRVSALFTVLVGDGVAYYIGSFFLNIMPLLFTGVVPSHFPYLDVVHFWLCTFYSYGGCHLILHLRSTNNSLWSLTSLVDCADMGVIYVKPPKEEGTDLGQMTRS